MGCVSVPERSNVVLRPGRREARQRVRYGLTTWFRTPPRRHGEVAYTREVSFLELFYDLVYVVLIGRATRHLAAHVDWESIGDFATVFGLIWLAWYNGTFWHELHGRDDGRSRNYIFLQMGLLALLAVFTGEATARDGREFAITTRSCSRCSRGSGTTCSGSTIAAIARRRPATSPAWLQASSS